MTPTLDTLTNQILALPAEQRLELVQRIWRSVEEHIDEDAELFAEIDRREAEVDAGLAKTIPLSDAMRQIRESRQ
jgi:putative addiction module component (TIGR02574 family)